MGGHRDAWNDQAQVASGPHVEPPDLKQPAGEMPRWHSHKEVEADRIVEAIPDLTKPGWGYWHLACGQAIRVSPKLYARVPEGVTATSGYYVRYGDGFESWSPAAAFDEGYTRI